MSYNRLGAAQKFTMSGTSQATTAFGTQTRVIRVATHDQPAYIKIGPGTPTAAATETLIPIGYVEYFSVSPGEKLAVFQGGTAGAFTVTEMA